MYKPEHWKTQHVAKIKDSLNKWELVICYLWLGILNIVKVSVLPRFFCGFNTIPIKNTSKFFLTEIGKFNCKIRGIAKSLEKPK